MTSASAASIVAASFGMRAQPIGDLSPGFRCGGMVGLHEHRPDGGRHHLTLGLLHIDQSMGPDVNATSLPRHGIDGSYSGERMRQAAAPRGIDVQVSTREPGVKGFKPSPFRWRIEGTFGTLATRYHRLTRKLEQSPTAAEDAVVIENGHRLVQSIHRR